MNVLCQVVLRCGDYGAMIERFRTTMSDGCDGEDRTTGMLM